MKLRYLKTTTQDGLIFTGQLFSGRQNKAVILHIHGMGGSLYYNSFYPFMQEYYPKNGFDFLVVEHRGTHSVTIFDTKEDGVRIIGNAYEKFEDSFYDIDAWVQKVMDLGYKKIILQGHSLGPSKVVYYYLNSPKEKKKYLKALVLISPVDMLASAREDPNYQALLAEAKNLIEKGRGEDILSHNLWGEYPQSAATFVNFFAPESAANIFPYHEPESPLWRRFSKIGVPVIAFTGTEDVIEHPFQAMELLRKSLVNSPCVETIVFEGAEHDFEGFGKELVRKVVSFLKLALRED